MLAFERFIEKFKSKCNDIPHQEIFSNKKYSSLSVGMNSSINRFYYPIYGEIIMNSNRSIAKLNLSKFTIGVPLENIIKIEFEELTDVNKTDSKKEVLVSTISIFLNENDPLVKPIDILIRRYLLTYNNIHFLNNATKINFVKKEIALIESYNSNSKEYDNFITDLINLLKRDWKTNNSRKTYYFDRITEKDENAEYYIDL